MLIIACVHVTLNWKRFITVLNGFLNTLSWEWHSGLFHWILMSVLSFFRRKFLIYSNFFSVVNLSRILSRCMGRFSIKIQQRNNRAFITTQVRTLKEMYSFLPEINLRYVCGKQSANCRTIPANIKLLKLFASGDVCTMRVNVRLLFTEFI